MQVKLQVPVLSWVKELWLHECMEQLHQCGQELVAGSRVQQQFLQVLSQIEEEIRARKVCTEAELLSEQQASAKESASPAWAQSKFALTLRWRGESQSLLVNGELFTPQMCKASADAASADAAASAASAAQDAGALRSESLMQQYYAQHFGKDSYQYTLASFLKDWFDEHDFIRVQTSGSTGTPKQMQVKKEWMSNSAALTLEYLNLYGPDCRALSCMNLAFIGGKMLIVRALLSNLHLVTIAPCGTPLQNPLQIALDDLKAKLKSALGAEGSAEYEAGYEQLYRGCHLVLSMAVVWHVMKQRLDFAAMVPLQVFNCLNAKQGMGAESQAEGAPALELAPWTALKTLIIGGGEVKAQLNAKLQSLATACYSTYGMTETVSHIALRPLNGPHATAWYYVLSPLIHVSQDSAQCLRIEAPLICNQILQTRDLVTFNEQGGFKILGRLDNVINTGGIKVSCEQVENELAAAAAQLGEDEAWEFQLTSRPDEKFGQIVVLLFNYRGQKVGDTKEVRSKLLLLLQKLPKYHRAKFCIFTPLPRTATDKPDRAAAKHIAASTLGWAVASQDHP